VAERSPLLTEETIEVAAAELKGEVFNELKSPVARGGFTVFSCLGKSGDAQVVGGWFVHAELMRPGSRSVRIVFFEGHDGPGRLAGLGVVTTFFQPDRE